MPLVLSQLSGFNAFADETSPLADPDLWLWVSSDYGVTYNGVTRHMETTDDWLDRSGNNRHLSSDISRYTLYKESAEVSVPMPSGKPVIRFDPTDPGGPPFPNQKSGGVGDLSRNCTVYMLVMIPFWEWPKYLIDGGNALKSNTIGISMQPASGSNKLSISAPLLVTKDGFSQVAQWIVITAVFNGANSSLQVNNGALTTGNPTDATTQDPYTAVIGGYISGTYQAEFDCGAVIISNSPNNAAIQAIHKNWLADYAGITL